MSQIVVADHHLALDKETGVRKALDGQRWEGLPNETADTLNETLLLMLDELRDMRRELSAMRLGMMDAGTCKEINPRDVEQPLWAA